MRAAAGLVVAVYAALAACHASGVGEGPDARESPQASAEPAPLAAAPTAPASAAPAALGVSSPPIHLRSDERLEPDAFGRDTGGYTLSALFRPVDVSGPARTAEVNLAGIESARRKTELRLAVDLTASRMRVVLVGGGFVLPAETEIRARADRQGHVVVWPGGTSYRPVAPGAMRALLGERRFDVAPIGTADVVPLSETGKRIGIKTRKVEVTTRAAKATFDVGKLDGLGEGGILLCRLLLDLMNAPPQTGVCGTDELPVRADLRWIGRGTLGFELSGVLRKTDLPQAALLVPPPGASFAPSPLPSPPGQTLLTAQELAAFRTGPIDVPAAPTLPGAPTGDGLVATNTALQLRVLYIDGVPVAWAAPGARHVVTGLVRGRYVAQWRTFLGDAVDAPSTITVPGAFPAPAVDGGTR